MQYLNCYEASESRDVSMGHIVRGLITVASPQAEFIALSSVTTECI